MRYALYIRKSSQDDGKQVQSLENQEQILREKAKRENLTITKVFKESMSAKKPYKRVQFNSMLAELQDGNIDGIICWSLCRLSRNPVDGGTIQQMLIDGTLKEIITNDRKYYPCDNSIMMNLELGMAVEYSLALGKNTKRGQKYKVEKGIYPNNAPLGYINRTDRIKGEKDIILDPERTPMIRKLWDLLLEGQHNVNQLTKIANDMGLRSRATRNKSETKLSRCGMYGIFTNPFYYGKFKWGNEFHHGIHEPMITKEEFEKAQKIISKKKTAPKTAKYSFALKGFIHCGTCGASVTAETKISHKVDGTKNHRTYYHCTHKRAEIKCNEKMIRQEDLEEQFSEILNSITIPDAFVQWACKWLKQLSQESATKEDAIKTQQLRRLTKIDSELNRLLDLRISNEIDKEMFDLKKSSLIEEKQELKRVIDSSDDSFELRIDKTIDVLEFCKEAKDTFDNGGDEDKILVLKTLGSQFYLKDKKLTVELAKPFKLIQDGTKSGLTLNTRFSILNSKAEPEFDSVEIELYKNGGH